MSKKKSLLLLSLLILGYRGIAEENPAPNNYELNQKINELQQQIDVLKRKNANAYYVKIKGDVYDTAINTPNDTADIGDLGVDGGLTLLQSGIAIGPRATVKNAPSEPTIGGQRDATNGIAIGVRAKVFGAKNGLAIGTGAKVDTGAQGSIAIGTGTEVSRKLDESNSQNLARWSVAIGTDNVKSHAENGIAIGSIDVLAENIRSVAIGSSKIKATQETSVAIGSTDVQATNMSSVAIGSSAISSTGHTSVALGSWSVSATASTSVALGSSYIEATEEYALAVGSEKVKSKKNKSVAMGAYRIISDADNAIAIGSNEVYSNAEKAIAFGNDVEVNDKNSIAIGSSLTSRGLNAITIGNKSTVSKNDTIAIGSNTIASGINGITIGNNSKVLKDDNVALGSDSIANTESKILGYNPYEMFNKEVTEEDQNKFITDNTVEYNKLNAGITKLEEEKAKLYEKYLEYKAKYEEDGLTSDKSNMDRYVYLMQYKDEEINAKLLKRNGLYTPWLSTSGAVSVGNSESGITRQITNVSAGTLLTDAVNVAQLRNVTLNVRTKEDGDIHKIKLSERTLNLIGENGITTRVDDKGNIMIGMANGTTPTPTPQPAPQPTPTPTPQPAPTPDNTIGTGKVEKDNSNTVTGGTVYNAINPTIEKVNKIGTGAVKIGDANTVTGDTVAKAINSIDRVKFSTNSEYLTLDKVETTDKNGVKTVDYNLKFDDSKLGNVSKSADAGIASAIAMANLPQVSNTTGHRFNIASAIGIHKGETAISLGLSGLNYRGTLVYRASGTLNTKGDVSFGVGIGYQFDKNTRDNDTERNSINELKNKLENLSRENSEYKKEQEQNKDIINQLLKRIELLEKNK
ncbi:MAG: YadA-like family protein [Streptobacillus sp.]